MPLILEHKWVVLWTYIEEKDSIPVVTNQSYKQQLGKTIEFNAVPEDNIVHIIKDLNMMHFLQNVMNN